MTTELIGRRGFLLRAFALLAASAAPGAWAQTGPGNFKAVYLDVAERDRFYKFLQTVFHLYPEERLHQLILDLTKEKGGDREIYEALLAELPKLRTSLSPVRYDLPALRKQKAEMTRQALDLLGPSPSAKGFMEVGSPGRYWSRLKRVVRLSGPVYVFHDEALHYDMAGMVERGGPRMPGKFLNMGDYEPVPADVPDASLDLVVNFIGFHHAPAAKLAPFLASLRRVLRPGGRMLVRDHDVDSPEQDTLTALAHDVFNAGLLIPWTDTARQVRLFRSQRGWTDFLEAAGFKRSEKLLAQDNDPTRNLLARYTKA